MNDVTPDSVEKRYQRMFGRGAGYMPPDLQSFNEWLGDFLEKVEEARPEAEKAGLSPSVAAFARLIEENGIARMYVEQMIEQQVPPPPPKPPNPPLKPVTIYSTGQLLLALDYITKHAPEYNPDPQKRNAFPMSTIFVYMMMTTAGEAAFRYDPINNAIRDILQEWGAFLSSDKSLYVLNEGVYGWLSKSAYDYNKLCEFIIPDQQAPHWGWTSYNDYFHREIKPEERPISDPDDPKVIVSANDGTVYAIANDVKALDKFWIKGQPYSLVNMLNNNEKFIEKFVGGYVFQSFLSGANYHRWRAPIDGTVVHTELVDALMFSDAESAGFDPDAGTLSLGYEASVNTRGLVYIQSPDPVIGMVCVIPIGITEISSVNIKVQPGTRVAKGDELGNFSYGGSTLALVFQPGSIDHFTVTAPPDGGDDGPSINVNAQIALAK
jgi:phosphatidylserine decarboxylase